MKIVLSDFDLFIRNLKSWKIAIGFIIVIAAYYVGHSRITSVSQILLSKKSTYNQLINNAEQKYSKIQKLSRFKSNTIFLMSKLQTLNLLKEILTKHNFSYVIYIQQSTVSRHGNQSNAGMINVNRLTARTAKMGIYRYIPIKIMVKNYVDFSNLLKTIKELQKEANFVLTGVSSLTSRGSNTIMLIGKLYVR